MGQISLVINPEFMKPSVLPSFLEREALDNSSDFESYDESYLESDEVNYSMPSDLSLIFRTRLEKNFQGTGISLGVQESISSDAVHPLESNPFFFEDLEHFMDYSFENARELGVLPPTDEEIEEEFSCIRPVQVELLDRMGAVQNTYRRYSLSDIGSGGYKRVQKRLYVAEDGYYIAADASVKASKKNVVVETLNGEVVEPLHHEMEMYNHIEKMLSTNPDMSRYFLEFYGCARNEETGEVSMSLEVAKGFEGCKDLEKLIDTIVKLQDTLEWDDDFDEIMREEAKNHLIKMTSHATRFFIDGVIAVRFLHENNVYCSDIKPGNLFLHADDNGAFAKLGDFGSSMFINHPDLHLKQAVVTDGYHDRQMMADITKGKMDPRQADLFALWCCVDELRDTNILSSELYERIMALPWDDMYKREYATNLLPALQTLLILQ